MKNCNPETGITNANGTTVTKVYDDAGNLTSVTNKNSTGTVLSSFSYVYDTDNRRKTCTEASGDVVTYGYDWGSRLTTESRTGANAYSLSYILDGVGNRTSQTKGAARRAASTIRMRSEAREALPAAHKPPPTAHSTTASA